MFDKEVILEYIIAKKNEYSRKLKQYEKLKKKEEEDLALVAAGEVETKVKNFLKNENNIVSKPLDGFKSEASTSSISNMANGKDKVLPSFWLPGQTQQAEKSKLEKPNSTIYCPVSGKPLKVKDLIDVKFTPIKSEGGESIHTQENRYMCAVTRDVLSNSVPCAVLKPT